MLIFQDSNESRGILLTRNDLDCSSNTDSGSVTKFSEICTIDEEGKPKCGLCHKMFRKQSELRLHVNIHYFERPFRCDVCAVSFRTKGHLQKHKISPGHFTKVNIHTSFGIPSNTNPRPFKCTDCKVAFRIHGHLAKHLRSKMHILKLECSGKLPIGCFAEMERVGINLDKIDTKDCERSLESLQEISVELYNKNPSRLTNTEDVRNIQDNHSDVFYNKKENYPGASKFSVKHDKMAFNQNGIFAEQIGPVKIRRNLSSTPLMSSSLSSNQKSVCVNPELECNTQVGDRFLSPEALNLKNIDVLCLKDITEPIAGENRNQKIDELEKELEMVSSSWDAEIRNIRQNMDVLRNEINSYKTDF